MKYSEMADKVFSLQALLSKRMLTLKTEPPHPLDAEIIVGYVEVVEVLSDKIEELEKNISLN
jgi:hypothetical protein